MSNDSIEAECFFWSQRRVPHPLPLRYHTCTRKSPTHPCVPLKTEHRKESHIPFLFPSSLQVLLSVSVLERGRVPQKWQPQPPDRSPYTHEPQAAFPAHCDCDFQFDRNAPFPESVLHKLYLFSPIESQPSPGIPLRKRGIPSR